jgi:hypothetical protein
MPPSEGISFSWCHSILAVRGLVFRFDLLEFVEQGLVADPQIDRGAFSVAAG